MSDRDNVLAKIDRLLDRIAKAGDGHGEVVDEIKHLLRSPVLKSNPPAPRRTGESTKYSSSGTGRDATLAEYRPSGQSLRVHRRAFDAVVNVLATAQRPLAFDELQREIRESIADPPAEWQTRVAVRFLLKEKLIQRSRSRYSAITPEKLGSAAKKAWTAAAAE